jgi:hypothetical protein
MNLLDNLLLIVPENLQMRKNGHQIPNAPIFPNFLVYNTSSFATFSIPKHAQKKIFPRSIAPDWE